MARVKRGSNRRERRKKVLAQSSGYYGNKGNAYRIAKQAVDKSGVNAYRDRRLKKAGSEVNRKMLAELAVHDAPAFGELVAAAKAALGTQASAT